MTLASITSWQINEEKWKQQWVLFSWSPRSLWMVTAALKLRHLLLGRKAMTNLDSVLKSRDIALPAKVCIVKAMVFPAVSMIYQLMIQLVKNPPAMQETWVRSLGCKGPLETGTATHSSILTWRIPWTV